MKQRSHTISCRLDPLYGIRHESDSGSSLFVAEHVDPQFIVSKDDGSPLALRKGHYEFTFSGTAESGSLIAPCIYIDYGDGYVEGDGSHLYLTWQSDGLWSGTILLLGRAKNIRLDPSIDIFSSSDLALTLRRVRGTGPILYSVARKGFRTLIPGNLRRAMTRSGLTQRIAARLMPAYATPGASDQKDSVSNAGFWSGLTDDYWARMNTAKGGRHAEFGAISARRATDNPPAFKPIAYYLPQMHPFPENDAWWGRGFTEWTNVSKAVAQFRGHYQPKLPGELGFYDLRVPETMARQIELAKLYGLHGFCFYYYWFGGKRLLEKPVDMFLSRQDDAAFDMPFCLCWANENWTRRWDGAEQDVLMAQTHTPEDHLAVINDLIRHFRDKRYITVGGKPVILLYRPLIIPDLANMLDIWRTRAAEAGLPGLHIVATNSFGFDAPEEHGFDALCGFPPHGLTANLINYRIEKINANYSGYIFDYAEVVDVESQKLEAIETPKKSKTKPATARYPGVMVAWDNEARKPEKGNVFHESTPSLYRRWLETAAKTTARLNPPDNRFVFINAWNEWAEGAYLEPDRRFGYGYLAATADVVREASADKKALHTLAARVNKAARKADTAVCLHAFYPEMIEEFAAAIKSARRKVPMDVILTVPDTWTLADASAAVAKLKPVRLLPCPNRGRDVLPFLQALQQGQEMGYIHGCKLHTKKSPQNVDGDAWRQRLVDGLLGRDALAAVQAGLLQDDKIAIAAPQAEFSSMTGDYVMQDNMRRSRDLMSALGCAEAPMDEFIAGTMFWFRFTALEPMTQLGYTEARFGPELGQLDGTLAHAFERVFVAFIKATGGGVDRYAHGPNRRKEETVK
jgi:lipopolysaccharide biosynthesis protein